MLYWLYIPTIVVFIFIYYMQYRDTRATKSIILGVTLNEELQSKEEIKKVISQFKNMQIISFILISIIGIILGIYYKGIYTLTLYTYWIILYLIPMFVIYGICNKKLLKIKYDNGLTQDTSSLDDKLVVDTSSMEQIPWISPLRFLIPMILSLLPCIFNKENFLLYLLISLLPIAYYLVYRYTFRLKNDAITKNPKINNSIKRIKKYNFGKSMLYTSYINILYSLSLFFIEKSVLLSILLIVVSILLMLVLYIKLDIKTREITNKLIGDNEIVKESDEDRYWLFGQFYYNPNDDNLMIATRVGIGTTLNLAKTTGKIIMILSMILFLLSGAFMAIIENSLSKPFDIKIEENKVIAYKNKNIYEIPKDEIVEVKLLDKLPNNLYRKNGTSTSNYLKGDFSSKDYKNLKILLDPTYKKFILIITKDKNYILNTRDLQKTEEIYSLIKNLISKS